MKKTSIFRYFTGANALLVVVICVIFVVPLIDAKNQTLAYKIGYTALLFISALSLQTKKRTLIILIAAGMIVLEWLAVQLSRPIIFEISQIGKGIYLIIIVIGLIRQTAVATRVTEQVIVDAISGYLLLGMVFFISTVMIAHWNPGAYSFSTDVHFGALPNLNDFIYYTFITYTTTGYGDLLPVLPVAKSFSILTAASGQLYIATIISLLVGKFASSAMNKD